MVTPRRARMGQYVGTRENSWSSATPALGAAAVAVGLPRLVLGLALGLLCAAAAAGPAAGLRCTLACFEAAGFFLTVRPMAALLQSMDCEMICDHRPLADLPSRMGSESYT